LVQMARRFRDRGGFDAAYDVPYTTVHAGLIRGGTALNIVPRDCQFDFEIRHLPFDDPETLLAEVRRFAARRHISTITALRRSSAALGASPRRISPTSGLSSNNWRSARLSCVASRTA